MRPILVALVILIGSNFSVSQKLEDFSTSDFSEVNWLEQLKSHYAFINSVNQNSTEKLDSLISSTVQPENLPVSKRIYFLEDKKEIVAAYSWEEEWKPALFSLTKYNSKGLLEQESTHRWDGVIGNWDVPSISGCKYNYDSENRLISMEISNTISLLPNIVNDIETYDYKNGKITEVNYFGVHLDGELLNIRKTKFSYKNDKLEFTSKYTWIDEAWLPKDSVHYTYNSNGKLYKKDYFTKNFWQSVPEILRESYQYNYKDNMLKSVLHSERYDTLLTVFRDHKIKEYNYLPNGSLESVQHYDSNQNGEKIEEPSEIFFTYNDNILFEDVRYPRPYLFSLMGRVNNHQISESNSFWPGNENQWPPDFNDYRSALRYFYSSVNTTSDIEVAHADILQVYPNPARDYFVITGAEEGRGIIHLYDTGGRLILHEDGIHNESKVDISLLKEGLYYYSLKFGERVLTGSVVKIK